MIDPKDTLWGFGMKRYFLGLALALLAIPGVSRAEIVAFSSTTGLAASSDKLVSASTTISYNNNSGFANAGFSRVVLILSNNLNFGGFNGFTGTLALDFSVGGGATVTRTAVFSQPLAGATREFNLTGLSTSATGPGTLQISYNAGSTITDSGTSVNNIEWYVGNGTFTGDWSSGGSVTSNHSLTLYSSVPEPTTMLLTGSVLGVGFGASMLRRFRSKSNVQEFTA